MPFNGAGSFSPPGANYPAVANTLITAANRNGVDADFATGLSTAICKDGQTTITANIPFAGFKITGLGAGSALTDAANLSNVINGTGVYVGTVGGTANAITLTPSPAITSYSAGQRFRFIVASANTSTVTVAVSGLTAKAITKNGTTALRAGDLPAGFMADLTYDGTEFVLTALRIPEVGTDTGNNTWLGATALDSRTSGQYNVAIGTNALTALLGGSGCVGVGYNALAAVTSGTQLIGIGMGALGVATTLNNCIAIGENSMGAYVGSAAVLTPNVALGCGTLQTIQGTVDGQGDANTAIGDAVLQDCTTGYSNCCLGDGSGTNLTTGFKNTLIGSRCSPSGIITGNDNTFVGRVAGHALIGGVNNTGVGSNVMYQITNGTGNTAVGVDAGGGSTGNGVTTGTNNTFLGYGAKPGVAGQLTNACAIGYNATVGADNTMVFGNTSVTNYGFGTLTPTLAKMQLEFATTDGLMIRNTAASGVAGIFLRNPSRQWELYLRGDSAGAFDDEFRIDDATSSVSPFRIQAAGASNSFVIAIGGVSKIGGTATRATTEGTNHLDIFDGTAPVGTLANGCSLYSTSGELRVMDAAGNATLLSPHDHDGYWIYHSKDTTTGKVLKIDMEKMLKKLNDQFGWDFVQEFIEA